MNDKSALSVNRDDRLAEVLDAYLAAQEAGTPPDVEELLARYPDLAGDLRECLASLAFIRRAEVRAGSVAVAGAVPTEGEAVGGTLGDFRIVREVGRGGMGVVYEAEQVSLRRRVALKVLPYTATMDARQLRRFQNEAQAAACLHHTNIVPVYFVGCERGVHFYAMQFIDGQPLSELIRQLDQGPTPADERTIAYQPLGGAIAASPTIPEAGDATPLTTDGKRGREYFRKVAEWGVQAAEALDHAHQLGIVHRDIKPGNLLLDGRGNLWVTDFGLAQVQHAEGGLTMTGDLVGTLRYMSPEQALAKRVVLDHRTDIYSLGITLYELLTLRPAFGGNDRQELLRQVAFDEPVRPRRLNKVIPAELETIVLKAMEKRPQDRYATAQALADDLERWLRHEPIHARRPTLVQRAIKWGRRHRPVVAACVTVLLMALGLGGYIGWMRHERAMQRAGMERVVLLALDESDSWQRQRRLPEALSAARRAEGLLAGADVDEALRARVRSRVADLELLERLESIRLGRMTTIQDGHFNWKDTDDLYGRMFRDAGLDVESLPEAEAAERIGKSTVAAELAAILDHWALVRRNVRRADDPSWIVLLRVARVADSDEWRTRVREALEHNDAEALLTLASSEKTQRHSPATLLALGDALSHDKESRRQVEAFLREAQRQHPDDFWLNTELFLFFFDVQPPRLEEAFHFAAVAVALRPRSLIAHNHLGAALAEKGCLDEAIAEYREAIRINKDYPEAHTNLGHALQHKGHLDEAIAEYREAIRINKDFAGAHYALGNALGDKGNVDEAIAEYREAIRIKKDYTEAHNNLGNALKDKGLKDEALAEYREAIRINKDFPQAHLNLGNVLYGKGRLDEAIAEYREAIRINKDYPEAHTNLGHALEDKGLKDEALAEFREAIRINKDLPVAHHNLGVELMRKGMFRQAAKEFRLGSERNSKNPLAVSSAQWARYCERFAELDSKLPAFLSGQKRPADAAECLALALLCQMPFKKRYTAAVLFFRNAFAEEPNQSEDLNAQHRYNAACAAALASYGQGNDADKLDAKERARLHQQALAWLRADLKAYRQMMEKSADKAGPAIAPRMQHWLQDGDFAGVRGDKALARLPEAERKEWQKLWAEVEALRQRAVGKPAAASPARP